jgi:N-acetylglucosamine-6-phosphate deacetylase
MIDSRSPATALLLRGALLTLPSSLAASSQLLIKHGTIAQILSNDLPTGNFTVIDLDGHTLYPGFIDVHIHGAVGVDTMDATAEQLRRVSKFLASQGVTGWLPTLVPASDENYRRVVDAVEELIAADITPSSTRGARVFGMHYEGPFVNSRQCGALHSEHFKTYADESQLDGIPVLKNDAAKMMMTVAPEVPGGMNLVRSLVSRGWIVSIGHTRASLDVLNGACAAGARHMTHFMNAMAPLHHRNPGPVAWGLSRDDVTCDIIADGVHLDPFMLRLLLKVKGAGSLSLISDAIAAAGKGDGDYQIWGETITVREGRTSNAAGSIAGSVITMLDAVRMMRSLGVSDVEIAQMAATNPARLLRLDHECGSIEAGKRADLVALDKDGNVRLTVVGGEVVFQA